MFFLRDLIVIEIPIYQYSVNMENHIFIFSNGHNQNIGMILHLKKINDIACAQAIEHTIWTKTAFTMGTGNSHGLLNHAYLNEYIRWSQISITLGHFNYYCLISKYYRKTEKNNTKCKSASSSPQIWQARCTFRGACRYYKAFWVLLSNWVGQ